MLRLEDINMRIDDAMIDDMDKFLCSLSPESKQILSIPEYSAFWGVLRAYMINSHLCGDELYLQIGKIACSFIAGIEFGSGANDAVKQASELIGFNDE